MSFANRVWDDMLHAWRCIAWVHDWSMYKSIRSRFSNCSLDKLALLRFPDLSFSYHLVIWCDRPSYTSNYWFDWTSCLWVWIMSIEWFFYILFLKWDHCIYIAHLAWQLLLCVLFGLGIETSLLKAHLSSLHACSWKIWRISACKEVCKSFPELIKYYILIVRARKL